MESALINKKKKIELLTVRKQFIPIISEISIFRWVLGR